jgi:hypothetical protein
MRKRRGYKEDYILHVPVTSRQEEMQVTYISALYVDSKGQHTSPHEYSTSCDIFPQGINSG